MPSDSLRAIIARHGLAARKSLGQHFILDPDLLARIARLAGPLAGTHVIEIGPGPGGLTRALLESDAASVTAIELDPRAIAATSELHARYGTRLRIIEADALTLDLTTITPPPRAIVANLPYNAGTAMLIQWLHQAASFQSMTLMFQREVAERITAAPNTPHYGRLAILTALTARANIAMTLEAAAFTPPPKVDSALVHLTPHPIQPAPDLLKAVEHLTATAFNQRRKMLRSSLKPLGDPTLLTRAALDPERRAETLTPAEFVALAEVWGVGEEARPGALPLDPAGALYQKP